MKRHMKILVNTLARLEKRIQTLENSIPDVNLLITHYVAHSKMTAEQAVTFIENTWLLMPEVVLHWIDFYPKTQPASKLQRNPR